MTTITFAKTDRAGFYAAEAAGHTFRLFQHDGAWFLRASVTGAILGVEVKLDTMTKARAVAARFADTIADTICKAEPGATVISTALDAAIEFVAAPAAAVEDQAAADPVVVIACAAAKADAPAPAAELYASAHFALNLRAAKAVAAEQRGRVLILSALHGLINLDTVVAPYDVKMGDPGSITVDELADQVAARRIGQITTLLPLAYARRLDEAVARSGGGELVDLYAEAPGIGYQRGVAAAIVRELAA